MQRNLEVTQLDGLQQDLPACRPLDWFPLQCSGRVVRRLVGVRRLANKWDQFRGYCFLLSFFTVSRPKHEFGFRSLLNFDSLWVDTLVELAFHIFPPLLSTFQYQCSFEYLPYLQI